MFWHYYSALVIGSMPIWRNIFHLIYQIINMS
jgi:hypothetical protein